MAHLRQSFNGEALTAVKGQGVASPEYEKTKFGGQRQQLRAYMDHWRAYPMQIKLRDINEFERFVDLEFKRFVSLVCVTYILTIYILRRQQVMDFKRNDGYSSHRNSSGKSNDPWFSLKKKSRAQDRYKYTLSCR